MAQHDDRIIDFIASLRRQKKNENRQPNQQFVLIPLNWLSVEIDKNR